MDFSNTVVNLQTRVTMTYIYFFFGKKERNFKYYSTINAFSLPLSHTLNITDDINYTSVNYFFSL